MNRLRPPILLLFAALALTACSSADGGSGPGTPPGDCRHVIDGDIRSPFEMTNGGEGCDYYLAGQINVSAPIEVQPGTVIVAARESRISVGDGGSITARGSAEERITFVGQDAVPGSWFGICFGSRQEESVLDHVDIFWAGAVFRGGSGICRAAIGSVPPETTPQEPVHITNTRVAGSATTGIDATSFLLGDFSDNALAGNAEFGLRVSANNVGRLDSSTDYSGRGAGTQLPGELGTPNGREYVFISGSVMRTVHDGNAPEIWQALDVPYYNSRHETEYSPQALVVGEDATLLVEAGATIVFGPDTTLSVQDNALLVLAGEPGAGVTLVGEVEAAGSWRGLWLNGGGLWALHTDIRFAGQHTLGREGALVFSSSGGTGVCSDLRNVTIADADTHGILITSNYRDFVHLETDSLVFSGIAREDVTGSGTPPAGPPVLDEGVACGG